MKYVLIIVIQHLATPTMSDPVTMQVQRGFASMRDCDDYGAHLMERYVAKNRNINIQCVPEGADQ